MKENFDFIPLQIRPPMFIIAQFPVYVGFVHNLGVVIL
jgi:hypothetical protein